MGRGYVLIGEPIALFYEQLVNARDWVVVVLLTVAGVIKYGVSLSLEGHRRIVPADVGAVFDEREKVGGPNMEERRAWRESFMRGTWHAGEAPGRLAGERASLALMIE